MSRKVVLDKGSLNRERPVTKALKFPYCTRERVFFFCVCVFFLSELKWTVREGVYTERTDDRYGSRIP